MAIVITTIAEELFEKICARFANVGVNNSQAKETQNPEEARFFNFDYLDSEGVNFGNVTVSIADEENLKLSYGMNISKELNQTQKNEWYDFLRDMRMFAKRNMMGFIPKDISKDRLDPKDIKKMSSMDSVGSVDDSTVTESRLFGTTKTSYEPIAPGVRLTIRHSGAVDDSIHGARTRKIQSVYVEDAKAQRFLCPTNHLSCCRALARHVANEGSINDEFGTHLLELSKEMGKIKTFVRASRNKVYENDEANDMAKAAVDRFHQVRKLLGSLSHHRSYLAYKESWEPSDKKDEINLDEVRSKFVTNNFDPRLEEALPYVYAAHKAKQEAPLLPVLQSSIDEFAESLDGLLEDGNASLSNAKVEELVDLMSAPLMSGNLDGLDASASLQAIFSGTNIDISSLLAEIYEASDLNDELDIRPLVFDWLQSNVPDIGQHIEQALEHGAAEKKEQEPEQPAPDTEEPEQEQPAQESIIHEDEEIIYFTVQDESTSKLLYTGNDLDAAKNVLETEQETGKTNVKLYQIRQKDGKKYRKVYNPNKRIQNVEDSLDESAVADIRRLAGLH